MYSFMKNTKKIDIRQRFIGNFGIAYACFFQFIKIWVQEGTTLILVAFLVLFYSLLNQFFMELDKPYMNGNS